MSIEGCQHQPAFLGDCEECNKLRAESEKLKDNAKKQLEGLEKPSYHIPRPLNINKR